MAADTVHVVIETQDPRGFLSDDAVGLRQPAVTICGSRQAAHDYFWRRVDEVVGDRIGKAIDGAGERPDRADEHCTMVHDIGLGWRLHLVEAASLPALVGASA